MLKEHRRSESTSQIQNKTNDEVLKQKEKHSKNTLLSSENRLLLATERLSRPFPSERAHPQCFPPRPSGSMTVPCLPLHPVKPPHPFRTLCVWSFFFKQMRNDLCIMEPFPFWNQRIKFIFVYSLKNLE